MGGDKMKQSETTGLFISVCIAVLLGAFGIGLGIRQIRFARVETQASVAVKPEKPADKPESDNDEVVVDIDASSEPSEEWVEEPYEEPEEEFAARPGLPEGGRMMGGEMRERFQYMSEEERARMELEVARAEVDQENYRHLQEIWPTLSEEEREEIRDIQERWPTMSEEERDYYRAQSLGAQSLEWFPVSRSGTYMSEEEVARMELEVARAGLDQENYRHLQEIWPTLSEEEREEIRDIQEKWPTMSEEERDYYRTQSLDWFPVSTSGTE
jgi:hypothetical protein